MNKIGFLILALTIMSEITFAGGSIGNACTSDSECASGYCIGVCADSCMRHRTCDTQSGY